MIIYFTYGLLLAFFMLPGPLLGDLVFRCPSCTAENLAHCPKVTAVCREIVREPGCGCCPVCARMEGELCGVYMPRCSTGLRCYPSSEAELPLQQLIQGLGRCGQKVNVDVIANQGQTNNEVFGTQNPLRRPIIEPRNPHDIAILRDICGRNSRMKPNPNPNPPRLLGGPCEQELHKVLEEIDRMASNDNRGPLENLYMLKFPNCDKDGLYNLKQCNMSTHGQRGECWCVNPLTGVQIPETPKVRGDPNCNQFHEELRVMPTAAASR